MQTEAGKAVADVLDVLAAKFGTTAAYLWGVLVKQAMVAGVFQLVMSAGLFYAAYLIVTMTAKWSRAASGDSYADPDGRRAAGLFALIPVGIGCALLYGGLTGLLNPEYSALREVLSVLKPTK